MAKSARESPGMKIVVLSGPSGSGKTSIVERLIQESPVKLLKSVSATTRPKRNGEVHGDAYYFVTKDEFQRQADAGEFIETAEVYGAGHLYGTMQSEIARAAAAGAWAFLEIDVQGALKVMEKYPDALSFFIKTASEHEFEQRLRNRKTETEEVIQRRMATAREELKQADRYRYQIVNDDLDRAVSEIANILCDWEAKINA
jgi:guanylate kinase